MRKLEIHRYKKCLRWGNSNREKLKCIKLDPQFGTREAIWRKRRNKNHIKDLRLRRRKVSLIGKATERT